MSTKLRYGVVLLTRSDLQLVAPKYRVGFTSTYGSTAHWEGPEMGLFPHAQCAAKWRAIQRFHMAAVSAGGRGWSDVAYNFGVCPHGYVLEGRGFGIKSGANGTNSGNATAHAVCYLSGQGDPFTPEAALAFRAIFEAIDDGFAGPNRNCHRDWKPTACPGDDICSWVHAGQPIPDPEPTPEPEDDDMAPERIIVCADPAAGDFAGVWFQTDGSSRKWVPNENHADRLCIDGHAVAAAVLMPAAAGQPDSARYKPFDPATVEGLVAAGGHVLPFTRGPGYIRTLDPRTDADNGVQEGDKTFWRYDDRFPALPA